jgi:hypothetical protein
LVKRKVEKLCLICYNGHNRIWPLWSWPLTSSQTPCDIIWRTWHWMFILSFVEIDGL